MFVYGTLRPGQSNYRLLRGAVEAEYAALLPGHRMYAQLYPYVAEHPDSQVVGDLIVIERAAYDEVLASLDSLEGYQPPDRELYVRAARRVWFRLDESAPWRAASAWVYLGGASFDYGDELAVPGGDWRAR